MILISLILLFDKGLGSRKAQRPFHVDRLAKFHSVRNLESTIKQNKTDQEDYELPFYLWVTMDSMKLKTVLAPRQLGSSRISGVKGKQSLSTAKD